jgi:hypothetical protein
VKRIRDAQKEYFRTRATSVLEKSKKLEIDVDQMIAKLIAPIPTSQSSLF